MISFPIALTISLGCASLVARSAGSEDTAFFTSNIEPLLRQRCYECHSHEKKIKGELALDSKSGWQKGGASGSAVEPGQPDASLLIKAVSYLDEDLQMPPKEMLPAAEIALLTDWIQRGAADPRGAGVAGQVSDADWEAIFKKRMQWWSLQPVAKVTPPQVKDEAWCHNEIDRFILAGLESKGLTPVPPANAATLERRLAFALTGLPPGSEDLTAKNRDHRNASSARASSSKGQVVTCSPYLESPHFGERFARHWMDVMHYSDTHGYEWDVPAKNVWRYRDYLIRAFNGDVPFNQLVREHLAGDLLPRPRVDLKSGVNESIIGPAMMRLGERRHGDSIEFPGVTEEGVDNVIDTVTKGFLATTVACAHCHDHKLDAVAQRDYYSLFGVLMSSRWLTRQVDTTEVNEAILSELADLKISIRRGLADVWMRAADGFKDKLKALPADEPVAEPAAKKSAVGETPPVSPIPAAMTFPRTALEFWKAIRSAAEKGESVADIWQCFSALHERERNAAVEQNKTLRLLADFTQPNLPVGWQVEGWGMKHGLVRGGEPVVMLAGDSILQHLLPAGRWTHALSSRLGGAVRSPLYDWSRGRKHWTYLAAGGNYAARTPTPDHALLNENMSFLDQATAGWFVNQPAAGNKGRRFFLELTTTAYNNNYPPRIGKTDAAKGVGAADPASAPKVWQREREDEKRAARSWFGLTKVFEKEGGGLPKDELSRFVALFPDGAPAPRTPEEAAALIARFMGDAVARWQAGPVNDDDTVLLNQLLDAKLLPNDLCTTPRLEELVARYRETELRIVPDRTVGSMGDLVEGRNHRIGIRGSWEDHGQEVARGNIRFLDPEMHAFGTKASGRLELAEAFARADNPLTARVFVNRVWHWLWGQGLVRTVDDFGHLGEQPANPPLLDWLANRFIEDGWSLKKLVRLIVASAAWQQGNVADPRALELDPENRLCHYQPARRLDAESIRDAMLAVSGSLKPELHGPPVEPFRTAEDWQKRFYAGPLDGEGRRSLYTKISLGSPSRFFASFNQPLPKYTVGKRDVTNVPDQALAMLNDPLVLALAKSWAERVAHDKSEHAEPRLRAMWLQAFHRQPSDAELARFTRFVETSSKLRDADAAMTCIPVWQDVAHAIFNMGEFIYVR